MPASAGLRGQDTGTQAAAAFALLLGIMLFTPVFRAGGTPLAALASQLLATGLLAVVLWSPQRIIISAPQAITLTLLVALPALYLIPLPADVAGLLPGRALYAEAEVHLPEPLASVSTTLALYPGTAAAAVLSLALPIGVFLGVRVIKAGQVELLIGLVIAIAALQALLGLMQYGTAQGGGTPLTVEGSHRLSAVGTYANRNHLGGLIEMVLPLTLALLFYALSRLKASGELGGSIKRRALSLSSRPGHAAILYAATALLLIVGVVFSRSRTGIALTMLGILASAAVFSRKLGRRSALGPAGVIVTLAAAAGISIGLAPVLDRFSVSDLEDDARWQIFNQTLLGAGALFPVGAGPGSFPFAFPVHQPLELGRHFINRAHNDYLEWLFDLGFVGILLVGLVFALYLLQWLRVLTASQSARMTYIQTGCGVGVLLLGLHEVVDYNLFTPANQVVFALLLSVFLYPPDRLAETARGARHRKRNTPDLVPRSPQKPMSATPPRDQIENPFRIR